MIARTIAAATHGRYLVAAPSGAGPWPLLVGFHGYAEAAETQLDRLSAIDGAGRWIVIAIQGLHRFYRGRTNDIVASWMTRQDREMAMADNAAYISGVVDAVSREWSVNRRLVFAGFSQGVAMAFRAGATSGRPVSGIVACGGDVPPELDHPMLAAMGDVLVGRGRRDEWYTPEKLASDDERLRAAGVNVRMVEFDGGHEWTAEFNRAAATFLAERA